MKTLKPNKWKQILATPDWGDKFSLLLDQDNYDKDMTKKEVKALLRKNKIKWSEFSEWIQGQTCPVLENGEYGYYLIDVRRFIRHKTKGSPLIFD